MRSILEDFACGNINPEQRFIKRGSEYAKALDTLSVAEEKLRAALNDSEKELLNALLEAQGAVNHLTNIDRFVCGYRLGALMTMDVFDGKQGLTSGQLGPK